MKIGVFGGTFDPPHNGHLIVAEYVRHRLGLDKIIFVPSWISPHKQEREVTDASRRLAMLRLAVQGAPGLEVSDVEVRRGGVSYTVDTLTDLLIGADNFIEFGTWHEPDRILSLARLVVMTRPGSPLAAGQVLPPGGIHVDVPDIAVTATAVRAQVGAGRSIRHLVPERVEKYIRQQNLYTY
jgi:nicotinate-nucleotide adenylyltransferase